MCLWFSEEETELCRKQLKCAVITARWLALCRIAHEKHVWRETDGCKFVPSHRTLGCSKQKSTRLQLSSGAAKSIGFHHGFQLPEDER